MAERVRGALNQIDWSKSNRTSINVKSASSANSRDANPPPQQSRASEGDIPVNQYRSIVAPVKSAREEERSAPRSAPSGQKSQPEAKEASTQVYVGYLGSVQVPTENVSTGINAIQKPMSTLYLPYREKKLFAQERVITFTSEGVEAFYLANADMEEVDSLLIPWHDILYVEPLRFTTKKANNERKGVMAAFEPCEAQRLAMLGNRDALYNPLSKQHKHISLLRHPALLCLVVRSPNTSSRLFTQGYICGTVEESVFLARRVRDELEASVKHPLTSDQLEDSRRGISAVQMSTMNSVYKLDKQPRPHSEGKEKSKKKHKQQGRGGYTTHTGEGDEDLGTFHFGMSLLNPNSALLGQRHSVEEADNSINDNFLIGQRDGQRRTTSMSSLGQSSSSSARPVGVVQPQAGVVRDGYRVLPSHLPTETPKLKPTPINMNSNRYSDVTPELDLKLRMRQQEEDEPQLQPLAPRFVVNPLAETGHEKSKSFLSATPGPISKMSSSLPFKPNAALLPQSGWHEPVIGNLKSKEMITNKQESEMVSAKDLPKLKSEKKEQELANLFSDVDIGQMSDQQDDNFTMKAGPTSQLHDAMGFLP